MSSGLSDEERVRYSRQTAHYDFDESSQLRLKRSSVLVVGCGGLGSVVLMQLAASGIGRIDLIDGDAVEISNLHRQIAHDERSIGENKAISAKRRINLINSATVVNAFSEPLEAAKFAASNRRDDFSGYDVIVNCTDTFGGADECNRLAKMFGIPMVSASVVQTHGELAIYNYPPDLGPCFECVHYTPGEDKRAIRSAAEHGVFGPVVGLIASAQAMEIIKLIVDKPIAGHACLRSELVLFDCSALRTRRVRLRLDRRPDCGTCFPEETRSGSSKQQISV